MSGNGPDGPGVSLKVYCGEEVRRFRFDDSKGFDPGLKRYLAELFGIGVETLVVTYDDDEGDTVKITSQTEFDEARRICGEKLLRLKVASDQPAVQEEEPTVAEEPSEPNGPGGNEGVGVKVDFEQNPMLWEGMSRREWKQMMREMGPMGWRGEYGPGHHPPGPRGPGHHPHRPRGPGHHPHGPRGPGHHPRGPRGPGRHPHGPPQHGPPPHGPPPHGPPPHGPPPPGPGWNPGGVPWWMQFGSPGAFGGSGIPELPNPEGFGMPPPWAFLFEGAEHSGRRLRRMWKHVDGELRDRLRSLLQSLGASGDLEPLSKCVPGIWPSVQEFGDKITDVTATPSEDDVQKLLDSISGAAKGKMSDQGLGLLLDFVSHAVQHKEIRLVMQIAAKTVESASAFMEQNTDASDIFSLRPWEKAPGFDNELVPAAPLFKGDMGPRVAHLHYALTRTGYLAYGESLKGRRTKLYGDHTVQAVEQFQKDSALLDKCMAPGVYDAITREVLLQLMEASNSDDPPTPQTQSNAGSGGAGPSKAR